MRLEGGGKAAERAAGTRGWESGGHGIAESSGCGGDGGGENGGGGEGGGGRETCGGESGEGGGNLSRI